MVLRQRHYLTEGWEKAHNDNTWYSSPNIMFIKLRTRWAGHASCTVRNAYNLVAKSDGKRPFGRYRRKRDNKIR
jgi:hypothetical protein